MRNKKNAAERIAACGDYLFGIDLIPQNMPVRLEIGCGKGGFICKSAETLPEVFFIGMEKIPSVIVSAIEKANGLNLDNLKFITGDAKNLPDYFPGDFIDLIYLNFSDPWHKRYQHDRRLTSPFFLNIYKKILKKNSKIILKTDNINLFDYSLKTMPENNFNIKLKTYDLYKSEFYNAPKINPASKIQTEYEKKFLEKNIPVCYLEAELIPN
ncbi:MAG: tRNA (guanosine(46)-N7)-methyltransferase TrmB [Oscillospiraceae bacterium]|nr:tRNA (guanosine(46)-N7)-methyltransferase TrmB [Oscillospiraceae bacterium]